MDPELYSEVPDHCGDYKSDKCYFHQGGLMAPPAVAPSSHGAEVDVRAKFKEAAAALEGEVEVWSLTFALAESMCLKTVVVLGIPDILHKAGRPLATREIAQQLGSAVSVSHLDRILQLLAAKGVFSLAAGSEEDNGTYGLNDASKWLIVEGNPLSMAPLIEFDTHPALDKAAHLFPEVVANGGPSGFERATGSNIRDYAFANAGFASGKQAATTATTLLALHALHKVDKKLLLDDKVHTLVEFSGGNAHKIAAAITAANPRVKVVAHQGGPLEKIPSADAVLVATRLNIQADDTALGMLTSCYKALPSNGKLILLEMMLPSHKIGESETTFASATTMDDFLLVAQTSKGKVRTKQQLESLVKAAGFSHFRHIEIPSMLQAFEATK